MTHQKRPGCALVTGASGDIGAQIALRLAQDGWNIAVGYATGIERAEEVAGRIRECGVSAMPIKIDVTSTTSVDDAFDALEDSLGQVTVLVNNAGIQHVASVQDFPPEKWDAILAINLSSAFHTTRLALPHMLRRNWGRIINVASAHGLAASAGKSAYVAAKHGLIGLTKAVALENATTGVTCNAICPGWVLTPLVQKQIDDRASQQGISVQQAQENLLREKEPSLQFTTPQQLGQMAVFLCSPAADNMRGIAWSNDGGWTAQ